MEQKLKSENINRLENILKVSKETESIAKSTSEELDRQTEVIDRITDHSHQVSENLSKSEKIVNSMSGFFCKVKNIFSKKKPKESRNLEVKQPTKVTHSNKSLTKEVYKPADPKPAPIAQDEEDKYLDEIISSVDNIKNMAVGISDTLDSHNKKLDVITDLTDRNNVKLNQLEYKAKKLMN